MEVSRNYGPENHFLQKVRKLATEKGIVLVFDECTSGFRQTFGGLHKLFGVEPDMAMFGKALGNGYAITAVIGRREVMEAAQTSFISSTFWTERIGPTAALATLKVMEKERSWERITETGKKITAKWQEMGKSYDLPLTTGGLPAITSFQIASPDFLACKTFITQEMLKQGFLASNAVFVCLDHTDEILGRYFEKLEKIISSIQQAHENGRNFSEMILGPICHGGFKRLN